VRKGASLPEETRKERLRKNKGNKLQFDLRAELFLMLGTDLTLRQLRTKLGAPLAIKAMAAKLVRLVYRMLRYGMPYIDRRMEFYDAQHRKVQINYLKRKASQLI
jgi:hypothetical protein